jgi:hypothetical protein
MSTVKLKRWLPLTVCLIVALLFYGAGMASGALSFALAGALFELLFWFGLFRRSSQT